MERILIPIFSDYADIWSVIYGMQLAKRTNGKVYILEIEKKEKGGDKTTNVSILDESKLNFNIKEVDYAHVKIRGEFLEKCIDLIKEEKIDIVVVSIPHISPHREEVLRLIKTITSGNYCKIELTKNKKGE